MKPSDTYKKDENKVPEAAPAHSLYELIEKLAEPARMEGVLRDLRHAARVLYKKPLFSLVVIATLALGLGANTAIFSLVNAAILTPIPVPQPDRVAMVWSDKVNHEGGNWPASIPDFQDWQATGAFESLAGFTTDGYDVRIGDRPVRVPGAAVTKEWFDILQVRPTLGRVFTQEDMQPGHDQVLVLTNDLWRSLFNADPAIIGKTSFINSNPYTVIGVLPAKLAKAADEKLYIPLLFEPPLSGDRGLRFVTTAGRLAPGVSLIAAQNRLDSVSLRLQKEFPNEDGSFRAHLQPIEEAYVEDVHTLVLVLFGAVGFVLLVTCANIANLSLVRGTGRQRELAVRAALGAGKFRLMRQLLTESVLLAALGGVAGIVPAYLGIRFLAKFKPEALPNADLITLNPTVLLFSMALALVTGLVFGAFPAWDAWQTNATTALRERSQVSGGRLRFGNLFVIGEVALTVVLVAGATLMLRSFLQLRSAYPGYDSQVLTLRVSLTGQQYDSPDKQVNFYKEALRRLSALPGVRSTGAIDCLPTCTDLIGGALHFTDRPEPKQSEQATVIIGSVTPDYFHAMGIPLVRGRLFSASDGAQDPLIVILDEATARRYWPNQDPIGQRVKLRMKWPLRRIVGVVGDVDRNVAVKMKSRIGQVYVPFTQSPFPAMSLVISSSMNSLNLVPAVQRELSALAPDQPVFQVETLAQARAATQISSEFGTWLLGFFAVLSMVLAALGVYGVVSYTVEQRTREFGVRMAIGATPMDLLFGVLKQGFYVTLIGLGVGLAGALALSATMRDLLHGLSATDPWSLLGSVILLAIVGLLATFIPAQRATRVEPSVALRYE
jgi:putative ABC transport system permease protein